MGVRATAAAALLALWVAGCGGDPEPLVPETPPPPETLHEVGDLPDRWEVSVNRAGGFAFGLPPGWRARNRGIQTLVRSFDRLAAVSIVPDRTAEAVAMPLEEFASRAMAALGGFEEELVPRGERPFEHRYEGVEVRTRATAADTRVRQRVRLIVLRRPPHVTLTVVIAANVEGGRASERIAERLVRTIRSRPVTRLPGPP